MCFLRDFFILTMLRVPICCLSSCSRICIPLVIIGRLSLMEVLVGIRVAVWNTLLEFRIFSESLLLKRGISSVAIFHAATKIIGLSFIPRIRSPSIRLWSTINMHRVITFILIHLPHMSDVVAVISCYQYGDYVIFKQINQIELYMSLLLINYRV